ncbi:hypothetical protein MRX96_054459 [Rhipicephalus microplus]
MAACRRGVFPRDSSTATSAVSFAHRHAAPAEIGPLLRPTKRRNCATANRVLPLQVGRRRGGVLIHQLVVVVKAHAGMWPRGVRTGATLYTCRTTCALIGSVQRTKALRADAKAFTSCDVQEDAADEKVHPAVRYASWL